MNGKGKGKLLTLIVLSLLAQGKLKAQDNKFLNNLLKPNETHFDIRSANVNKKTLDHMLRYGFSNNELSVNTLYENKNDIQTGKNSQDYIVSFVYTPDWASIKNFKNGAWYRPGTENGERFTHTGLETSITDTVDFGDLTLKEFYSNPIFLKFDNKGKVQDLDFFIDGTLKKGNWTVDFANFFIGKVQDWNETINIAYITANNEKFGISVADHADNSKSLKLSGKQNDLTQMINLQYNFDENIFSSYGFFSTAGGLLTQPKGLYIHEKIFVICPFKEIGPFLSGTGNKGKPGSFSFKYVLSKQKNEKTKLKTLSAGHKFNNNVYVNTGVNNVFDDKNRSVSAGLGYSTNDGVSFEVKGNHGQNKNKTDNTIGFYISVDR